MHLQVRERHSEITTVTVATGRWFTLGLQTRRLPILEHEFITTHFLSMIFLSRILAIRWSGQSHRGILNKAARHAASFGNRFKELSLPILETRS